MDIHPVGVSLPQAVVHPVVALRPHRTLAEDPTRPSLGSHRATSIEPHVASANPPTDNRSP